jgi:hypothetical protein
MTNLIAAAATDIAAYARRQCLSESDILARLPEAMQEAPPRNALGRVLWNIVERSQCIPEVPHQATVDSVYDQLVREVQARL